MAKKKITNIKPETDTSHDEHITHLMQLEDRLTNSVFNLKALINQNVLSISNLKNEMGNAWNCQIANGLSPIEAEAQRKRFTDRINQLRAENNNHADDLVRRTGKLSDVTFALYSPNSDYAQRVMRRMIDFDIPDIMPPITGITPEVVH
jgi:hypothetical protein